MGQIDRLWRKLYTLAQQVRGAMPRVFSGQDKEISLKVRFGGIRRLPLFCFLPYFSNLSEPKLRLIVLLDDPKKLYKIENASIDWINAELTNRVRVWTGPISSGQGFEVTLDMITQSGILDYRLVVPIHPNLPNAIDTGHSRIIRIMNTGTIQSSENWFMRIVEVVVGALMGVVGTLLVQWMSK